MRKCEIPGFLLQRGQQAVERSGDAVFVALQNPDPGCQIHRALQACGYARQRVHAACVVAQEIRPL